jgi:hypothetical protein
MLSAYDTKSKLIIAQQRGSLHGFNDTTSSIPLQVVQYSLPGAQPRLRNVGSESQLLQSHGRNIHMASTSNVILHTEDLDAADSVG